MSTARIVSLSMMVLGAVAIAAAAAIGWAGFPPEKASAALMESVAPVEALGVEPGSAVRVGAEVPAEDRLDGAVDGAGSVAAAGLTGSAVKKRITKRATARKISRTVRRGVSTKGWRSARVSWYGPGFYGNTMAGGGKLRRDSMVVAHRSLKFGTRIEFTYKGRTVTAVVRDRGPFIGGRVFDLGPGTAKALKFSGVGTVKYRIL